LQEWTGNVSGCRVCVPRDNDETAPKVDDPKSSNLCFVATDKEV